MRRIILVTALVLVSASAQARISRGLTLASSNDAAVTEPSSTVDAPKDVQKGVQKPVEKSVEKPVDTTAADQPGTDPSKPAPEMKVGKPKPSHRSTEARVIYELHRHGIYW
jgi:hypothetical protein